MPLIQVTAPKNALDKKAQDALISQLSNAVLSAEKADINDPAAQALVWAYYSEQATTGVYVGGKNLDKPPLTIAVTTPQGALDAESRKILVKHIGQVVDDLLGAFTDRLNHWVQLYEVDEGSWAGAGQIFNLASIQQAMNIKAA